MKRTTKIFAWILSAALLLAVIPFAGMSVLATPPENLDFYKDFMNSTDTFAPVYRSSGVQRNTGYQMVGTLMFADVGGYVDFKTAKNSPFATEVRNHAEGSSVEILVSADGEQWSLVTPQTATAPLDTRQSQLYYLDNIGTDNQYVRIRIAGATNSITYVRSVSFNVGGNYTMNFSETKYAFSGVTNSLEQYIPYGLHSYTATAANGDTFFYKAETGELFVFHDASLIFKTYHNSSFTINASFNSSSVTLYASPTGEDGSWTQLNPLSVAATAATTGLHVPAIGESNQYVKVELGDMGLSGSLAFGNDARITRIAFDTIPTYTVSAKANYSAWGTVTGGDTYDENDTVTVTATPAEGCHFVRWSEYDATANQYVTVSTESTYTFTATANRDLVAEFEWDAFDGQKLIDFSDPAFVGSSNTAVNFDNFETAGIHAYSTDFSYHSGSASLLSLTDGAYLVFHVDPSSMFRATYWKAGTGSVTYAVSPTGTAGTWTDVTATVVSNSVVNGSGNQNWQIDNVGAETRYVRMTFNVKPDWQNYIRLFRVAYKPSAYVPPTTYTVGVSANDNAYGTVTGGETYEENAPVTVTAVPGSGYRFVRWTENGSEVSTQNPYTFNATANRTLVAVFEEIPVEGLYTIDFSETKFVGTPNTSVNYAAFEPSGIVRYSDGFGYHPGSGTLLTMKDGLYLIVRTEKNSIFRTHTWQTGDAAITFEVSPTGAADSWTAVNADVVYESVGGGAAIRRWQIDAIGEENQYVRMTFNAKADWSNYGRLYSVSFVQPTATAPATYTVGASANNAAFGTVSGGDVYNVNAAVTLTATPNKGYRFVKWTENDAEVSTENPYTFTATADRDLVAVFEQITIEGLYTIDFSETKFMGTPNTSVNYTAFDDAGILAYSSNFSYHSGSKSLLTMNNGSYLMFRVQPNSIFRAHAWRTGNASITFAVSPTGTAGSWTDVTATRVYYSEGGGAVEENWQIDAIGEENQYVRMTFNAGGDWTNYGRLFSVSYIQATDAGPDMHTIAAAPNKNAFGKVEGSGAYIHDSEATLTATAYEGYRFVGWTEDGKEVSNQNPYTFIATVGRVLIAEFDVDPEGDLPVTDTCLDFQNEYAASVGKAFMSENVTQPWQAGLCSDIPGANIVYKMQKNSPVLAVYRIFAETDMRPVFYASKDAKEWGEPLPYRTMPTPNPTDDARMQYIVIDGIGEENVYLKIQCVDGSNFEGFAAFYVDLRELNFVANTDPLPYDKTLNFSTDNTALGGLYAFTPARAVEQTIGKGVYLALDHLICKEKAEKVRLIVNVEPTSGFRAEFTVNEYAQVLGLLPKLYGSKDGETWTELPVDLFRQGETNGIAKYLMHMDPPAEEYAFFAFEFPQEKDYTGIELAELDDVVSDCLNSAVVVSSISYLSATSPAEKPEVGDGAVDTLPEEDNDDNGNDVNGGNDVNDGSGNSVNGGQNDGDPSDNPPTGDSLPKVAWMSLLLSAAAVAFFRKGKRSRLFAGR